MRLAELVETSRAVAATRARSAKQAALAALLAWQTERLSALAVAHEGHVVRVRPELVVEVAFDGVQQSPHYPSGLALRFARVKAHRRDKRAQEADTLATVRAIHAGDPSRRE